MVSLSKDACKMLLIGTVCTQSAKPGGLGLHHYQRHSRSQSTRSITSAFSMLSLIRLRLLVSDTMVTPPSSSSSLPGVAEPRRERFSRLTSFLIFTEGRLWRRRRFCSRSSSGVRSSGSRSTRGTGEGSRSMMPSISRSPVLCSAVALRRRLTEVRLTAGTVLENVGGDWGLTVRIADVDECCRGLCLDATEPEM